jgi:SNF family Na+-dependent transporter
MGSIQCYASYLRERDDIALNASSAGFMNEFVEVILGGSIIIPIAVAYLGLDWLQANVGFEMGFRTMPTLFQNWGPYLAALGGVAWFGLLFFAAITSSLAMGQPIMAFLQDEFSFDRRRSVFLYGAALLLLAVPCMLLYEGGAFNEYDYWVGTFSLFVFALAEAVIFAWVFGIDKAWDEINRGADMRVPAIYKYIIKFVTPTFLLAVFVGAVFKPTDGEWAAAFGALFSGDGWAFAADSVIGTILHVGVADLRWFVDGHPTPVFIQDASRVLLMMTFVGIALAVHIAFKKRRLAAAGGRP